MSTYILIGLVAVGTALIVGLRRALPMDTSKDIQLRFCDE